MSVNLVVLSGRLGKKPEAKTTNGGKTVVSISLAVDDRYGDKKKVLWTALEVWEKNAEALLRFGDKGSRLTVTGRLGLDEWEKDGVKQSRTKVIVNNIDFIDFPPRDEDSF